MKKQRERVVKFASKIYKSELTRTIGIYTFLNFFLRGISFVITPLFTNYISPDEFGNLNVYLNSINFIAPLIHLGIGNSISVDYFKEHRGYISQHLSTYLLFSLGITVILSALAFVFHAPLTAFFQYGIWILIAVPMLCFFNLITDILFVLFRNENSVMKVTIYTILKTIVEIGLSILFIIVLYKGGLGRIWSMMISTLLIAVICLYALVQKYNLRFYFNFSYVQKEIRFWISSIVGFLFVLSFTVFDKYIVKIYSSSHDLGNYSLASQFGFIILTFSSALSAAFLPNLYRDLAQKVSFHSIQNKLILIALGILLVTIGSNVVVFLSYKYLVNSAYSDSWHYYTLSSIAYGLWALISICYGFLYYYKMKRIILIFGLNSILVFLPLQYLALTYTGIRGMIISQSIYFVICLVIILRLIYKKMHLEIGIGKDI